MKWGNKENDEKKEQKEELEESEEGLSPKAKEVSQWLKSTKAGFVNGNLDKPQVHEEKKSPVTSRIPSKTDNLTIVLMVFVVLGLFIALLLVLNIGQIRTRFEALRGVPLQSVLKTDGSQSGDESPEKFTEKDQMIEDLQNQIRQKDEKIIRLEDELTQIQGDTAGQSSDEPKEGNLEAAENSEKINISAAVKIYELMEPDQAARVLMSIPIEEKIDVIKNMKKDKAAEILSLMDAKESAAILSAISKE